jgi:hypothetical protein
MSAPVLRSGGAPARLLLRLWRAYRSGHRLARVAPSPARVRLLDLALVVSVGDCLTLSPEGLRAARSLRASERA